VLVEASDVLEGARTANITHKGPDSTASAGTESQQVIARVTTAAEAAPVLPDPVLAFKSTCARLLNSDLRLMQQEGSLRGQDHESCPNCHAAHMWRGYPRTSRTITSLQAFRLDFTLPDSIKQLRDLALPCTCQRSANLCSPQPQGRPAHPLLHTSYSVFAVSTGPHTRVTKFRRVWQLGEGSAVGPSDAACCHLNQRSLICSGR
jgi:hypothetical protein